MWDRFYKFLKMNKIENDCKFIDKSYWMFMKKCDKRCLYRIIIEVEILFFFNKFERKLGNKIWVIN